MINYFLVASAVLATAYVSAISGKHYDIAVVVALAGTALTVLVFVLGRGQRRAAAEAEPALAELQGRIADRLKIDSFLVYQPHERVPSDIRVRLAFGLAALLSIGSVLYALIH